MWKYCILIYEHDEYVLQVDGAGTQIGSDISIAKCFMNVEELHEYASDKCSLTTEEYGVVGYFERK